MEYIMSLDEGTTSVRSVIYDKNAKVVAQSQKEFTQYYPQPSWVEHDALQIWECQLFTIREALEKAGLKASDISAVGITNQRETTVVWDSLTGKPIYNAIVWQCRRTSSICEDLSATVGFGDYVKEHTGLVIDAYFSATKIKWLLDNVKGARELAEEGRLRFGTMDTWLIYNLTGKEKYVTDYTNASRTMMFDINKGKWDKFILDTIEIPACMLPEVVPSCGVCAYTSEEIFGAKVPIAGVAGDQQASLFGQGCFEEGEAKNTYGTGCFLLMNTGNKPVMSKNGLVTTIAWAEEGKIYYALEGSVFMGGATVQWLRDELQMVENSADTYQYAMSVPDTNGVYIVPAFTGLGAPYWDMHAKGIICNLTRGVGKAHIIRAVLEAICYQVKDLCDAIEADSAIRLKKLMVDGGACANDFLLQFQSDILQVEVDRPTNTESTALGAALLAGLGAGIFKDKSELKNIRKTDRLFIPAMQEEKLKELCAGWKSAVEMCRTDK